MDPRNRANLAVATVGLVLVALAVTALWRALGPAAGVLLDALANNP